MSEHPKSRVLFSSVGAVGHVYPMLPLAQAVVRAGHDVLWACSSDLCPAIERTGVPTVAAGLTTAERQARLAERSGELAPLSPDERALALAPLLFGELVAPKILEDLRAAAQAWRPDLLIHDSMEFAAPIVAAGLGVPNVVHSFGPLTPEHRIVAISDRVAALWSAAGLESRPYGGLYDHLYLDLYPPSLQPTIGHHVRRRQRIRPVPTPAEGGAPWRWPGSAGSDDPLVYVTFGTEVLDDRPLRLVLEALAEHPLRLVVTVGSHRDPEVFGRQPANVVIERFVPHMAILPQAAAVVSHGGSGTVLAALSLGLPQLCLPYFADQPLNARALADAGAGLALDLESLNSSMLAAALWRLLTERSFKENACRIAGEISAMPDPDEVAGCMVELGSLGCSRLHTERGDQLLAGGRYDQRVEMTAGL